MPACESSAPSTTRSAVTTMPMVLIVSRSARSCGSGTALRIVPACRSAIATRCDTAPTGSLNRPGSSVRNTRYRPLGSQRVVSKTRPYPLRGAPVGDTVTSVVDPPKTGVTYTLAVFANSESTAPST